MTAGYRSLDAAEQDDAPVPRVVRNPAIPELSIVERNGQRAESKLGRAIYEGERVMPDVVRGVVCRVEMKVYFQHVRCSAVRPAEV
jgi:hypothetical protein